MELKAPVSTIMSKKTECVTPTQKLVDVKHLFEKTPFHHHLPVVEKDKLVGMISLVDFMRAIGTATLDDNEAVYQNIRVKDIMTEKPLSIKSDTPIRKAAKDLAKGEVHALVVADNGKVVGMVSYTDVINYLLNVLQ